jgi:hypothetical protein
MNIGEVIVAQYFNLDLETAVKWDVTRADAGTDITLLCGTRADVKTTETYKRFLIWSKEVNDLYAKKNFDVLIAVSVEDQDWSRCWIEGYVSKLIFWTDKLVADGANVSKGFLARNGYKRVGEASRSPGRRRQRRYEVLS